MSGNNKDNFSFNFDLGDEIIDNKKEELKKDDVITEDLNKKEEKVDDKKDTSSFEFSLQDDEEKSKDLKSDNVDDMLDLGNISMIEDDNISDNISYDSGVLDSSVKKEKSNNFLNQILANKKVAYGGLAFLGIVLLGTVSYVFFSSSGTPQPTPQEIPIQDENSTDDGENANTLENSGSTLDNINDSELGTGEISEENSSSGELNDDSNNISGTGVISENKIDNQDTNSGEILSNEGEENQEEVVRKDSSDISIPLEAVNEKIVFNKDGSISTEKNTDFETRKVTDGSVILDNSQNKGLKILELNIKGVEENGSYRVSDSLSIKLDGITNSMSVDAKTKLRTNGESLIIDIDLAYFPESLISPEKGILNFEEKIPLNFMTPGNKKVFILVNKSIYKNYTFNIK